MRFGKLIGFGRIDEFIKHLRLCSGEWIEKLSETSRENLETFFGLVRDNRPNPPVYKLRLSGLNTTLRAFQVDAVNFMVHREIWPNVDNSRLLSTVVLPQHDGILYFPYLGIFVRHPQEFCYQQVYGGGILADEMGLGKTVEVLALIMSHSLYHTPTLAVMEGNAGVPFAITREDHCEIETTVITIIEFLKSSVAASFEVEELIPPRKRFARSVESLAENPKDAVTCKTCGVQYSVTEVCWLSVCDTQMNKFTCPHCIKIHNISFDISTTLIVVPESLLHQWYEEIRRLCKENFRTENISFDISTTLIVVPESLLHQWYEEIRRLCKENFRTEIYYGVGMGGYRHPMYLGSFDIVLCTYETLQKEIHHVSSDDSIELRKRTHPTARKYSSPLLALNFWRICLDESQLVKSKVKAASKLCSLLRARNRWCVTGTPLSSSVNDLYGLLYFLRLFPYYVDAVWEHYLFYPYLNSKSSLVVSLMRQLLWRNTKKDVIDQLDNITRKDRLNELSFTPIEERLYTTKIEGSKMKMRGLVNTLLSNNHQDTPLSSLPSSKVDAIFSIINDVRISILAGESHKQMRDQNSISDFRIFSPKLIFRKLLEDATTVACQRYRDMIANRNALAALYILMDDKLSALEWYQKSYDVHVEQIELNQMLGLQDENVQTSVEFFDQEDNNGKLPAEQPDSKAQFSKPCRSLKIDSLQMIHMGRNVELLAETLQNAREFAEANGVIDLTRKNHERYVRIEAMAVHRIRKKWHEVNSNYIDINKEQGDQLSELIEESLQMPRSELLEFTHLLACKHNNPVNNETSKDSTRDDVNDTQSFVFPLPPVDSCSLCVVNEFLSKHESGNQINGAVCQGKNAAETFLTQLWLSRRDLNKCVRPLYTNMLNWLNTVEKLILVGRELTTVIQEWVNREREIVVAATRLNFGMEVQLLSSAASLLLDSNNIHTVMALCYESEMHNTQAVSNSLSALRYLNTLRRDSQNHTEEVRECPCCYHEMDDVWVVFPCAHTVCTSCMKKLRNTSTMGQVRCITCRQSCSVDATMYVADKKQDLIPHVRITVKFENIIQLLKKLIDEDYTNKIIVFTSISAAISPFGGLLKLLKMPAVVLDRGLKSKLLNKFRNNPECRILLLPLRTGANGLNLTEANHIVFMEPITEMSVLAQAIGRIDRIGQRRTITVHNFIVRGSIEEEIYGIVNGGTEQSKWTIDTLRQVFGF
ncbi:protein, SNF2 family [Dictyocaulus viviparus]|uniref:Protein, SNF2 family n=1 Tax=Dictyocaulus viviparus TaxID=29172 RepID=A0A0D8Y4T8_DICVI|nr:protein, SNF2 family [Dictyocaulus viviparus]